MDDYTVKLVVKGIPKMDDREFTAVVKWLKEKQKDLVKERLEYSNTYVAKFYI